MYVERERVESEEIEIDESYDRIWAVSYTHLDVYKRQNENSVK